MTTKWHDLRAETITTPEAEHEVALLREATDDWPSRCQMHIINALADKYDGDSLQVERYEHDPEGRLAKVTCPDVVVFVAEDGQRVSVARSVDERRVDLIESITADEWECLIDGYRGLAPHAHLADGLTLRLCDIARLTREIEEQA